MIFIMKTLHIILKLTVLAAFAAACDTTSPIATWQPPPTGSTSHRVVLFGDSLSVDAKNEAVTGWSADPTTTVSYNSFGGTRVDHWFDEMRSVPAGSDVVIALGTNDVGDGTVTLDQADWNGVEALEILEGRHVHCVTWLTVSTYSAGLRPAPALQRTRSYDTWLHDLDGRSIYPFLRLEEWDVTSQDHPDWLRTDLVHHTQLGQDAYALALQAAGSC